MINKEINLWSRWNQTTNIKSLKEQFKCTQKPSNKKNVRYNITIPENIKERAKVYKNKVWLVCKFGECIASRCLRFSMFLKFPGLMHVYTCGFVCTYVCVILQLWMPNQAVFPCYASFLKKKSSHLTTCSGSTKHSGQRPLVTHKNTDVQGSANNTNAGQSKTGHLKVNSQLTLTRKTAAFYAFSRNYNMALGFFWVNTDVDKQT